MPHIPRFHLSPPRVWLGTLALACALTACRNPDFQITPPPDAIAVQRGSSVAATINVARIDGFDGAVTLELTNPPAGVTAPSLSVPTSSTSGLLTLSVGPDVVPGLMELTVTGASLGKTRSATLKLNVSAPAPDFTLAAQNTPTVTQGETAFLSVKLERKPGFDGLVTLDVQDPPPGVSASPATVAPGVSSGTLFVSVASNVIPGSVPITVRGVSDGVTRTANANLTVVAAQDFTVRITGSADINSPQDRTISVPIGITRLGGFAEPIQFALEGDGLGSGPDLIAPMFNPNPVSDEYSAATLELKIGAQVTPKAYVLTIRATAGGRSRTVPLKLEVQPPLVVIGGPNALIQRVRGLTTVSGTPLTLARAGGFSGPVELRAEAPDGIQVSISPQVATGDTVYMFVQPGVQAPLGPNRIRVFTTNLGDRNVSASFTVDVLQPDFTISASNPANPSGAEINIPSGTSRNLSVSVANPQNGFSDPVLFDVTGLPAGASVRRVNVTPGSVGALEIRLNNTVPVGSYPITITGSHPGVSAPKTVPFTLRVQLGERLDETFSYSGGNLPNGWGTNRNSSNRDLWIKDGGALFAYANRVTAGVAANLITTTFLTPGMGFPCDGEMVLTFTSFFGSTGAGRMRVLMLNNVSGTPREIARLSYVPNGIFRFESLPLDKTYLSSGSDGRIIFEFTPSSSVNTEYWGVDNILVACR